MYRFLLVATVAILSACNANVTPVAVGGSRADGIVVTSYEYGAYTHPTVDQAAGEASALRRCKAWGYTGEEPFDAPEQTCEQRGGFNTCMQTRVNMSYQCTGSAPTNASASTAH